MVYRNQKSDGFFTARFELVVDIFLVSIRQTKQKSAKEIKTAAVFADYFSSFFGKTFSPANKTDS